jgi:hypothetical protein
MENEMEQLKREVEELKAWKEKKELQQISQPLDQASISVIVEALRNNNII